MPKEYTDRGFAVFENFVDLYDNKVRVQASSLANIDAVWIFCDPGEKWIANCKRIGEDTPPHSHLNVEQAKKVIAALQELMVLKTQREERHDRKIHRTGHGDGVIG